jgi:hypothetical protein
MNIYEQFSGITTNIKRDFKNYQPIVNSNIRTAYLSNANQRKRQGLTECKEIITLLIIKDLIPAWGIKRGSQKILI